MKKLVTVSDVKKAFEIGKKVFFIDTNTLVTPAAKDAAEELNLVFKIGAENVAENEDVQQKNLKKASENISFEQDNSGMATPELIAKIVREVMASLPGLNKNVSLIKEADPSGLRLVKGKSVVCENFNTGNPQDKVGIKEILTNKESPNMATGFMTLEKTTFSWDLKYEEIDYIIDGTLEMTVNGKTYSGEAGDVFYLPKDTTVTFSTPDKVKFFFVTYPANWAELSNYNNS